MKAETSQASSSFDDTITHSKNSLRAWLYLLKCAKQLEQEMNARFRGGFSSSLSRFDVLAHLYLLGAQGIRTTQLAGRLLASKGNITRLLDRMESDGLIARRANAGDRRISDVFLTEEGAKLFSRMASDHEAWSDEIFRSLSDEQMVQLIDLLRTVKGRLDHLASHDMPSRKHQDP